MKEGMKMFCSKCGNMIQPGASFCSQCGTPVTLNLKKMKEDSQMANSMETDARLAGSEKAAAWSDDFRRADTQTTDSRKTETWSDDFRKMDTQAEDYAQPQFFEVTFSREKQWFAINPKVKIKVDECDLYTVENGQSIRIPMYAGVHSIVCSCGIRNTCIELTVQQNIGLHLKWNRLIGSLEVREFSAKAG